MPRKSLRVWVLQTGEPVPGDPGSPRPMRAMNLCSALVDAGHDVTLWTSDFFHQEKRHRLGGSGEFHVSQRLVVRTIPSPGYSRNIGPARLFDHAVLAWNLRRALRDAVAPDVAFVGYPPIETAEVMGRWLAARGVPHLLDVKDQWPTLFVRALPVAARPIGRIAFAPYFLLARKVLRRATGLSAMANGFLSWALDFAGRPRGDTDRVVPLTPPPDAVPAGIRDEASQWWDARGVLDDGRPRFCFVGSHSQAFDFPPIVEAARVLAARGISCQFVICGAGEKTSVWKNLASDVPSVVFPGWVNRAQFTVLADRCFASLTPYRRTDDFALSIPNKVLDSLGFGLPLLSPLHGEVESLLANEGVGLSYAEGSGEALATAIIGLITDDDLRVRMQAAALRVFEEKFSYLKVYVGLVAHLEELARTGYQA